MRVEYGEARRSFHKGVLTRFGDQERETKGCNHSGNKAEVDRLHPLLAEAGLEVVDAVILMQRRKGVFIDVGNGGLGRG